MKNKLIMVFLDGVGIGEANPEKNPFFKYPFNTFRSILGDTPSLQKSTISEADNYVFPSDPIFGVDGLPQSGTGQNSIFCGIKAPQIINQHFGPYPHSTLHPYIKRENIFEVLKHNGLSSVFVNAYPRLFFNYVRSGKTRLSVTTLSCIFSGIPLNKAAELRAGKALAADITNERWITQLKYKMPLIKPELAAKRLIRISRENDFSLFEYFLTDHLGHHRNLDQLKSTLQELDLFLYTLLTEFNREDTTVLICSDHGNLEDISIKTHTRNPALTISAGYKAKQLMENVTDNSQIKKEILDILK